MKNQERWDFAQKYSAKEMIKASVIVIIISAIGVLSGIIIPITLHPLVGLAIILGATLAGAFIPIVKTERALKKKIGKK